jgi:hypothetical protein
MASYYAKIAENLPYKVKAFYDMDSAEAWITE